MTEPAENYVSPYYPGYFRAQAFRVWAVTAAIVTVWVGAIVLGPISRNVGMGHRPADLYFFQLHLSSINRAVVSLGG